MRLYYHDLYVGRKVYIKDISANRDLKKFKRAQVHSFSKHFVVFEILKNEKPVYKTCFCNVEIDGEEDIIKDSALESEIAKVWSFSS